MRASQADSLRKWFWKDNFELPQEQKIIDNTNPITRAGTVCFER